MYFRNNFSIDLKQSLAALKIGLSDERGWEAFYNFAATPWFRVTADAQFIVPGDTGVSYVDGPDWQVFFLTL